MDKRVTVVLSLLCAVLVTLGALARDASAHTMGLSTGRYEAHDARLDVEIAVARAELLGSCGGVDLDGDRTISPAELARSPDCLGLTQLLLVTADGARCEPSAVDAALTEADGALLRMSFTCPARPVRFAVEASWLAKLPASHRHVARAQGREVTDLVLDPTSTRFEIEPADTRAPGVDPGAARVRNARVSTDASHANLFVLGLRHIVGTGGLDHLAFLLGLVLVPAAWGSVRGWGKRGHPARALLLAITAFSVGHTLSLALAMSGVFVPDARFVEPLIALSIAWVGAENAFATTVRRRAWLTLPFGFVHGFGFAASLRELMGGGVGMPLFTFNLGVEVGQVVAVLPMLTLVFLAAPVRRAVNVALFASGIVLAIVRLAS